MFASVKRVTDVAKPMVANQQTTQTATAPTPNVSNHQKLELAKRLAAKINMFRKIGPDAQDITQQAAKSIMTGEGSAPQVAVS